MTERELHRVLCWALIATAAAVAVVLAFLPAPYGRHVRRGWGPSLPVRSAWLLMEAPAVLVFVAVYALGARRLAAVPLAFLALWQLHYLYRAFVFPFRLRADGRTSPVAVVAMGATFNVLNGYLNARHVSELGSYGLEWFGDPRLWVGVALFFAGRELNVRSDARLLRLRDQAGGYAIPRGGAFRWVSCPNYLGEIIEWTGWAIATWSLAGLAFALFTAANLAPRALSHHRWYRERFADYPRERAALVPGIF